MEGVEVLRDRNGNRIAEIQTIGSKQILARQVWQSAG